MCRHLRRLRRRSPAARCLRACAASVASSSLSVAVGLVVLVPVAPPAVSSSTRPDTCYSPRCYSIICWSSCLPSSLVSLCYTAAVPVFRWRCNSACTQPLSRASPSSILYSLVAFIEFDDEDLPGDGDDSQANGFRSTALQRPRLSPLLPLKAQLDKDKGDESLRRWKEKLLGSINLDSSRVCRRQMNHCCRFLRLSPSAAPATFLHAPPKNKKFSCDLVGTALFGDGAFW